MNAQRPTKKHSPKTGSNFPNEKALVEREQRAIEARKKIYRKDRTAFMRERKSVLTPQAIRKIRPIIESERNKFARASLLANGNAEAILKAKKRTRSAINRALPRTLPGYKRYATARSIYLKQNRAFFNQEIAAHIRNGAAAEIGELVLDDEMDFLRFTPPFPLYRVSTLDIDSLLTYNGSFADNQNGILFNSIKFKHNNDAWFTDYNPGLFVQTSVATGVTYDVPSSGYLKGHVIFRNLYNHYAMSLTDNFGLSHGDVYFRQSFFVEIYFRDRVRSFSQLLVNNGLEALGGTDLDLADSPIQTFAPMTLNFTVDDIFSAGDRAYLLTGSSIYIFSDLDDMDSHVEADLTWQVSDISLGVVP